MGDANGSEQAQPELNADGWENLITGLGDKRRDKRLGGRVKTPPVFIDEQTASDLYHGDDISQQIADVPPKEMLRQWVRLKVEELKATTGTRTEVAPPTSDELKESQENLTRIAKEANTKLGKLGARKALFEAMVWARVYGGSLLFLGVDDGLGGSPEGLAKPLDMGKVKTFDFLKVFNRHEVSVHERYSDDKDANFGMPKLYRLSPKSNSGLRPDFAHTPIHETRFIRFDGVLTSKQRRLENDGWSDSIYIRMQELLTDFGLSWAGIAHLIQDFAQAIFKMRGLKAALAADKDDVVINRMIIMDLCRSLARAIPLDADGEDFERKQTPVTGLPELMDRFEMRLAAAAKMPVTLLFGRSPAGMNATGDSDIRLFYDRTASDQETDLRQHIELLYLLVFLTQEGPTKGKEPEQWSITFNPLWQMTPKEQAELQKTTAEGDAINISHSIYTADEAAQSHYGGDEFSTAIELDQERRSKIAEVDRDLAAMTPEEIEALNVADPAAIPDPTAAVEPEVDPALAAAVSDPSDTTIIEPSTSLNGAQVSSLLELVDKVARKEVPRASAVAIIQASFNVEAPIAEAMMGDVGRSFFIEPAPVPAAFGGPPSGNGNSAHLENEDAWRADVVEKRGSKWVVLSQAGKVLGTHDTKEDADKQLGAIEAAKAARGDSKDTSVSPLRFTRFDQALHHTHWDPEQHDFMGPESIDPVTGEHVHERPNGSKSLPPIDGAVTPTNLPHRHITGAGPSGDVVPWFNSEAEEREHFLEQMSMDASHPTSSEPAFCDKSSSSYSASRCAKWRQSRQS